MTRHRWRHDVVQWLTLIAAIPLLWLIWPAWLGGANSIVVVSGSSMLPTYENGDVLVVRTGSPDVGDVIAFRVPGRAGQIVHRVIERRPDGTMLVQGDNRITPDLPLPSDADVVGVVAIHVPHGELLVRVLTSPMVLGIAAGCWVFGRGLRKHLHVHLDANREPRAVPPGSGGGVELGEDVDGLRMATDPRLDELALLRSRKAGLLDRGPVHEAVPEPGDQLGA